MAHPSHESAASPRSIGQLVANQRSGYSFDRALYTDVAVYELEMERIFRSRWLFVDHAARIPRPGDFILREIAGESIIVVRDHEAQVRAFYNVCRHRGSRLCQRSDGHIERFVCPYHAWTYTLDGRLSNARLMPPGFDPASHGLNPCHLRVVEGLVFISLCDGDPPAFDEMVAPFFVLAGFSWGRRRPDSASGGLPGGRELETPGREQSGVLPLRVRPSRILRGGIQGLCAQLWWGAGLGTPGRGARLPEQADRLGRAHKSARSSFRKLRRCGHV